MNRAHDETISFLEDESGAEDGCQYGCLNQDAGGKGRRSYSRGLHHRKLVLRDVGLVKGSSALLCLSGELLTYNLQQGGSCLRQHGGRLVQQRRPTEGWFERAGERAAIKGASVYAMRSVVH